MSEILKSKIFKGLLLLIAPVLSGVLLFLAFPTYDQGWLAWIALAPLFIAISGRSPKYVFLLSYLCAIIFFLGIGNWLFEIQHYKLQHHAIWGLYLACYFGLFGLVYSFISKRWSVAPALFAAPFLWVSLEYLRSNMGFMAFPWGLLSHSQYMYPKVIQIASVAGVYGVSFLVVLVNSALAAMVLASFRRFKSVNPVPHGSISRRGLVSVVGIGLLFTILTLIYGIVTVSKPIEGERFKVSVVQGNIAQSKKWDPGYKEFIMRTYADLTQEALKERPALIIWPEAATPHMIALNQKLHKEVRRIAETAGTYLLLGSSSSEKFKKGKRKAARFYNSAFLISPEDKVTDQRYDKIRLLPFGEYLPNRRSIPWQWLRVPNVIDYTPGKEFTVFEGPGFRFSGTICWETIFPELVREFVKNGAQFLVNITNEAWFGRTASPYQFLAMNVFRAVENRVFVVRCANTGVSCFIDPYGRIIDRVKDARGQDIFVRGVLTESVIPMESKTIYTRYGDWFVWLCFACSAGFLLMALFKKESFHL